MTDLKPDIGNAREIFDFCRGQFEEAGFVDHKATTLWRRTNVKFDILKFDILPKARCAKWRVPLGSFGLAVSCLFPFLPRLGHSTTDAYHPYRGFGQVRLSLYRRLQQPTIGPKNIWWPGTDKRTFDLARADVVDAIRLRALPFFSRFDEPTELFRTLSEDDDAMGTEGVWEIGKKGSVHRLLYLGFAAIECGLWELAKLNLQHCRQTLLTLPKPVSEAIKGEILPYINQGLAAATEKQHWTSE